MDLTIQDWGALGELIGAIAVVATLGYLAAQIRQNTRMMKATVRQELARASQDGLFQYADHANVLAKMHAVEAPEWSSTIEEMEAEMLATSAFRNWEIWAWNHREGLVDSSEWSGIVEDIRFRATFPYFVEQWRATRMRFSSTLRATLDPIFSIDE